MDSKQTFLRTFLLCTLQGVGALYLIMDTIKRKRAEQREEEARQKEEEAFHNKINRGRQLLKPLEQTNSETKSS